MKLWYIAIGLDRRFYSPEYCYQFDLRANFVSNYLSKQIRKLRFETDGTFQMIFVNVTPKDPNECAIVPDRALQAEVHFNQELYEQIKGAMCCEYYLEMLEEGFYKSAKVKKIPLETLLNIIKEFQTNGCKNEWLHKNKRFKETDVEVALNCYFTTMDFKLVATVKRISTKEVLCSGVILRTEPNEIVFDRMFKDIVVDDENIIVTDFLNRPSILIKLNEALNGQLVHEILRSDPSLGILPLT